MSELTQRISQFGSAFKQGVKQGLIRFRQGSLPNIAIFALRRGGSTLLAEMIAEQRGIHLINEPCAVFPAHPRYAMRRRMLPDRRHSQFFDLNEDEALKVETYFAKLLQARLLGACRRPKFPCLADRVVLKLLNVPALTDWLAERCHLQLVFLTRHPAAQARSVLRNRWGFSAEAYFERPQFLAQFYRGDQIEFGTRLLAEGGEWQKAILNWVVENEVPMRQTRSPMLRLTFEELILHADRMIALLCSRLSLAEPERMRNVARRPSGSSHLSSQATLKLIMKDEKQALLRTWQKDVGKVELHQAQEILDRFEVTAYSMSDPLPNRSQLILEPEDLSATA